MRTMRKVVQPVSVQEGQGIAPQRTMSRVLKNSFFEYGQNFTFVANENQQATIAVQSDAHFICVMTMYDTSAGAGASGGTVLAAGGATVQLSDTAAQRFLSSIAVPISALFGSAERPFVWPFTHLFRANGGINISITGTTGAAQTVRLVFAGYKIPVGSGEGF
jgi:hypothetical protein